MDCIAFGRGSRGGFIKVLVVDDESLVRRSLNRIFSMSGHEVVEAENGALGLQQWIAGKPDLVFLDVLMPELSGPEVLAKARHLGLTAKVIMMSAYSGTQNGGAPLKPGVDLYLTKPFDDIRFVLSQAEALVQRQ